MPTVTIITDSAGDIPPNIAADLGIVVVPLSIRFGDEEFTDCVDLTPTEFRLLAKLAAAPGEAVRRRSLLQTAWPHGALVNDNTLDVYIARLRRKLAQLPEAPSIHTVHAVGYSLR